MNASSSVTNLNSPEFYIQLEKVNLMCHLDSVAGCPGIWLNIVSEYVCEAVPRKDQLLNW